MMNRSVKSLQSTEGFVLPVVLLLLILLGGLVLAASSMANQQVRSYGELRTSVMATHAAEGGASRVANALVSGEYAWHSGGMLSGSDLATVSSSLPFERPDEANHGDAAWWVESMDFSGDEVTYRIRGEVLPTGTRRRIEVTLERGGPGSSSPFASAVVGCEGVDLRGSASIDSWDSREGPYSAALARAGANVGTISSTGDVELRGNSPIRGDVISARDIIVRGSAQVDGNYRALRDIMFNGNPACPGAAVEAGNRIYTPGNWWDNRCSGTTFNEGVNVTYDPPPCDPLGAAQLVADSMSHYRPLAGPFQSWPHDGWRPNPVSIESNSGWNGLRVGPGNHPLTLNAGAVDVLFVDGDMTLNSSSQFHIRNPSPSGAPQRVRIFVDGDFTAGGASRFEIDPGVSLSIHATGRVDFGGGHNQRIPPTVNMGTVDQPDIQPSLAIYTSFSGSGGVSLGGSSPLTAVVYAPLTDVELRGSSSLYGAVVGRSVDIRGSGSIHYDESLGLLGGAQAADGGGSRITRWTQIR